MFTKPFGVIVRQRRRSRAISQRDLAAGSGMAPQRLSQLELGRRQPTPKQQIDIQRHLGYIHAFVEPVGVTRKLLSNGRQCLSDGERYDPPRDRATYVRFAAARRKYPDFVNLVVGDLKRRQDFELCQAVCHQIAADSAEEILFVLRLLRAGALPCLTSPQTAARLPHRIIDPENGKEVSHRPMACLAFVNDFFFFQVTFRSSNWQHRVDVLRCNNGACSVVEIDGEGHDPHADARRMRQIGLPTVRLTTGQLLDLDFDIRGALLSTTRSP